MRLRTCQFRLYLLGMDPCGNDRKISIKILNPQIYRYLCTRIREDAESGEVAQSVRAQDS